MNWKNQIEKIRRELQKLTKRKRLEKKKSSVFESVNKKDEQY